MMNYTDLSSNGNDTSTIDGSINMTAATTASLMAGNNSDMPPVYMRYADQAQMMEMFAPASVLAERIVLPFWYVIGFLCNPACAVIWYGRRMRRNNSSAVYLGSLAVSDVIFLVLHLLYHLHAAYGYDVYNTFAGCEAFMFFFYIPQYLSVVLVAAFTIERYVAVCHPFLKEKWCTVRRAFVLVGASTVLCTCLSTAQIFIWTYLETYDACSYRPEAEIGEEHSFVKIWNWVIDMLMFAALPLIVLVFNVLVLKEIIRLSKNGVITRQQGRNSTVGGAGGRSRGVSSGGGGVGGGGSSSNNTASTMTLLSVSFFLIVTQLAATIVNNIQHVFPHGSFYLTDDQILADPSWTSFFSYVGARKIVDVLCMSHYACYFFVYCLTGQHFRREVIFLLSLYGRLKCWHRLMSAKTHKGERYSMVTSNGYSLASTECTMNTTVSTAFTTSM